MVSYQNHRADMVPVAGLEPARINRRILSAMRLPFRHTGMLYHYKGFSFQKQGIFQIFPAVAKCRVSCIIE